MKFMVNFLLGAVIIGLICLPAIKANKERIINEIKKDAEGDSRFAK